MHQVFPNNSYNIIGVFAGWFLGWFGLAGAGLL
jgi:hypothetical protein